MYQDDFVFCLGASWKTKSSEYTEMRVDLGILFCALTIVGILMCVETFYKFLNARPGEFLVFATMYKHYDLYYASLWVTPLVHVDCVPD